MNLHHHALFRVILFVAIIMLPMAMMIFNIEFNIDLDENRSLASPPKMRINRKLAKSVDRYVNDHFGGRRLLAKIALTYDHHLARKPVVKNVLSGKNGWLYFGTPQMIKKYAGSGRLSNKELDTIVKTINEQHRFCKDRGIYYLLVIAPDKNTIYPEYLPGWLNNKSGVRPIHQLMDRISADSDIAVLDLSAAIIKQKDRGMLYWRTDTHWTQLGAFYGYRQIATHLSKWFDVIRPMSIDDFVFKTTRRKGGDLAVMIGEIRKRSENHTLLIRRQGWQAKRIAPEAHYTSSYSLRGKRDNRLLIMASGNRQLPKAVVFSDSFIENLDSFLAEHFQRIIFHRHFLHAFPFDESIVLRERPDVVIMEVAERSLGYVFLKGNGMALSQ